MERRAKWAAGLGWGLDSFDFYLYVYGLPAILGTFALSKAAGGFLASCTLAASAIGGIVLGALADRIGRRRVLVVSILWYATFTFLSGWAQNYWQLTAFRTLEGFGFGGEWAVGAVLVAEWSSPERRGRNLGYVQGAWALGWLAANAAFQIMFSIAPAHAAWRYLFFLGVIPAAVALYIRRNVEDAPLFRPAPVALNTIFKAPLLRTTVLVTLLAIAVQSGYYALFTWMPTYLTAQRHLAAVTSGWYLYLLIAGAYAGYISAGAINDAIGRRRTFIVFSLCSAAIVPLYLYAIAADWQLLLAGPVLGYFASGIFSGFGPYLSELFPTETRATGQGFAYNVGRGVAGAVPLAIGAAAAHFPIGNAMTVTAVCAYLAAAAIVSYLPETRAVELTQTMPSGYASSP